MLEVGKTPRQGWQRVLCRQTITAGQRTPTVPVQHLVQLWCAAEVSWTLRQLALLPGLGIAQAQRRKQLRASSMITNLLPVIIESIFSFPRCQKGNLNTSLSYKNFYFHSQRTHIHNYLKSPDSSWGPSFQGNKAAYKDQRKRKDLTMEFYIRPNLTQKVALPTSLHFLTEEWGEEWADTLKSARERGCVWYKLGTQLQLKDTEVTADINDTGVPAETCVLRWRQPWPPLPKHPCAAFRTLIRQLSWKLSNSVWGQKWTSAKGDQYKPECHMVKRNLSWCDEHSWLSMMSSGIN